MSNRWIRRAGTGLVFLGCLAPVQGGEPAAARSYENRLVPVRDPLPILADYPRFVAPVTGIHRFESPALVDELGELSVRAWRFSYNARGIVEVPNRLMGERTAVVVVHPWGIDDGQGWRTPEPAGAAFQCTPEKNQIMKMHAQTVLNPLLHRLRDTVKLVAYSLPGRADAIRAKMYRSFHRQPSEAERAEGRRELRQKLDAFHYLGEPIPARLAFDTEPTLARYFAQFPGLDAGDRYDPAGFWELPIPVHASIDVAPADVAIYDAEGYPPLREFLTSQGVRHVLLAGYNTDMCVCSTTAGYENLSQDFNVFIVGDATLATFPANADPSHATNAALSFASLKQFITQVGWIEIVNSE